MPEQAERLERQGDMKSTAEKERDLARLQAEALASQLKDVRDDCVRAVNERDAIRLSYEELSKLYAEQDKDLAHAKSEVIRLSGDKARLWEALDREEFVDDNMTPAAVRRAERAEGRVYELERMLAASRVETLDARGERDAYMRSYEDAVRERDSLSSQLRQERVMVWDAQDDIRFMRDDYSPLMGSPCRICLYEDGVLVRLCGLHRELEDMVSALDGEPPEIPLPVARPFSEEEPE